MKYLAILLFLVGCGSSGGGGFIPPSSPPAPPAHLTWTLTAPASLNYSSPNAYDGIHITATNDGGSQSYGSWFKIYDNGNRIGNLFVDVIDPGKSLSLYYPIQDGLAASASSGGPWTVTHNYMVVAPDNSVQYVTIIFNVWMTSPSANG